MNAYNYCNKNGVLFFHKTSDSDHSAVRGIKFHPEILRGSPLAGVSNKVGVGKISSFLSLSVNVSKTLADTAKVTIND